MVPSVRSLLLKAMTTLDIGCDVSLTVTAADNAFGAVRNSFSSPVRSQVVCEKRKPATSLSVTFTVAVDEVNPARETVMLAD